MAISDEDKAEILAAIMDESQEVSTLNEVSTLDGVADITGVKGSDLVRIPISLLTGSMDDYPFTVTADRSATGVQWLLNRLLPAVITAEVVEHTTRSLYRYDLAYISRISDSWATANASQPEFLKQYYNAVVLGRWSRTNASAEPEFVILRDYVDIIKGGQGKFWLSHDWDGTLIRMLIDASKLPVDTALSVSNQTSSDLRGLIHIADTCHRYESPADGETVANMEAVGTGSQVVKVVGGELYIGAKYDTDRDITIHFKKCMFNELLTFFRVGLAANTDRLPAPNPDRDVDTLLNSARYSDNIGPLLIEGSTWTGGNHPYSDNTTKTAKTVSYEFAADGLALSDGDLVRADVVTVRVVNHIYDPRVAPSAGATHLSRLLCVETVTYRIEGGDIQVSVNHDYTGATPGKITTYYGMQSMCDGEAQILTPDGAYASGWTAATDNIGFLKSAYPNFRRILERRADGNMQLTLLYPDGIGDYRHVGSTQQIFFYNNQKAYHFLLRGYNFTASSNYSWRGLYSWMPWRAEVTGAGGALLALAYADRMERRLYVDVTESCDGPLTLPVPTDAACRHMEVVSGDDVVPPLDATAGTIRVTGIGENVSAVIELTQPCANQSADQQPAPSIDKSELFRDLWEAEFDCRYDPDNAPDADHPYYCNRLWLTYKEAIVVYNTPRLTYNSIAGFTALANNPKTIILASHSTNGLTVDMPSGFRSVSLQSIRISTGDYVVSAANISYAFAACNQLRYILGVFNFNTPIRTNVTGAFLNCVKLEEVRIKNLTTDISFANCPLISLESLQYLIDNAANTTAITITVHATTFAKLTTDAVWMALVDTAATKNIQFATA